MLLNPLDDRSPRWSPFLEARSARDFDTVAAALIPRQKDAADPFWITAARQLFSHGAAGLWQRGETRQPGAGRPPAQHREARRSLARIGRPWVRPEAAGSPWVLVIRFAGADLRYITSCEQWFLRGRRALGREMRTGASA